MPWPNPFASSAPAGGKLEATFGGPILLGKMKEGGVAGIGPLVSPSGALLIQSTGSITNQVVSTGAPTKAAFLYAPVSTASLITAGPPPYQGYGAATVFVNNTTDQHWEVWSTQDNEWIRFGQVSTVGSGGGSTFTVNGRWPEIAVYTSPGGNIGGYTDFTWQETSRLLAAGASTAIFAGGGGHTDNYSIGGFNVFTATTSGQVDHAMMLGEGNDIVDSADSYIYGEGNDILGGGPGYTIGRDNHILTGAVNYLYGDNNTITSTGGNNYAFGGINTIGGGGNSIVVVGLNIEVNSTSGPSMLMGVPVILATSGIGYVSTHEKGTFIVLASGYEGFAAVPYTYTLIYSESSAATVWGQTGINQTSSGAKVELQAASTADQSGAALGIHSAGSAGSTGSARVQLYSIGATGTIPFRFYESTVGNYVGLVAPTTMPNASFNLTLPPALPALANRPVVATTGGVMSFAAGVTGTITSTTVVTVTAGIITNIA